ncbi:MAG TPA: hypothetical protein VMD52_03710 [Patescibacteria group bacterium]|nr:hypothetical protein [Patescibacteria group bacterium]
MKECKYCRTPIQENAAFCPFCGYDPKADAISASFKPSAAMAKVREAKLQAKSGRRVYIIGPGIKMFAFVSVAAAILLLLYVHNFDPKEVISEIKQNWDRIVSVAKIKPGAIIPLGAVKKEEPAGGGKPEGFSPSVPLVVEGIVWESKIPQAIINNRIFNVGDTIEGAKIVEINKKGVTVFYKNRSYLLPSSVSKYWK